MQENVVFYFNLQEEPYRSCLLYLRDLILGYSKDISEQRKNNTPFYYYKEKWIGFISYHPVTKDIYISFTDGCKIDHPLLKSEGRKKAKIFHIDPFKDIDVKSLSDVLEIVMELKK